MYRMGHILLLPSSVDFCNPWMSCRPSPGEDVTLAGSWSPCSLFQPQHTLSIVTVLDFDRMGHLCLNLHCREENHTVCALWGASPTPWYMLRSCPVCVATGSHCKSSVWLHCGWLILLVMGICVVSNYWLQRFSLLYSRNTHLFHFCYRAECVA